MRWILLGIVVVSSVGADLLQSHEMKLQQGIAGHRYGPAALLRTIVHNKHIVLSIALMAVSFFAFLALVRTQPLSFAVPASAGSYVLEVLLAGTVLNETIGRQRAIGAALVLSGILFLAR